MKKQALFAFFASLVLMLGGCGSNDNPDGNEGPSNKSIAMDTSISATGKDFNLSVDFIKKLSSDYKLTLRDFKLLSVGGCEVESVDLPDAFEMKGGVGSMRSVQFSGTFKNSCTPTGYEVGFTQVTSQGDRSKVETIVYDSAASGSGGSGGGGAAAPVNGFFNATTPMQITQANYEYEIKVQVLEDGYATSGKEVKVKPFDRKFGEIKNPTTTTGSDGYAVFEYSSPTILPVNGTSVAIELTNDENNTIISQNITLKFSSVGGGGGSQYSLINETSIVVTAPDSTKDISAHLIDINTGIGASGKDVSITTINSAYGNINASTVTTDSAGKATFPYIAPSVLMNGSEAATISFRDDKGNTISKIVTITTVAPTGGGAQYGFINATDLNVTAANTEYAISVDLINNTTGVGVASQMVSISAISNIYGAITPASVSTDAGGRAVFTYKSAVTLTTGSAIATVRYEDSNGNTITENITIVVSPPVGGGSQYSLTSTTTPLTVNTDNEIRTISAVVIDQSAVGVKDVDVSITAISDVKYGAIVSASTIKTDASGRATFTYKAPRSVADVDGNSTTVKLFLSDYLTVEKNITIKFDKIDENISVPIVVISHNYKELNITQNSQNIQIEVQVFEQGTNTPYTAGNVKVSLPSHVTQGVDVGSFSAYTVAVGSNGKAVFNYTGPQDLQALIDSGEMSATFQFFHENNPTQKEQVVAIYNLQAGYIPANYLLSTSSSDGKQTMDLNKLKTFTLYLKDDQGTLIDDASINNITIISQNSLVGKSVDASSGNEVTTLTFSGNDAINSKSFSVKTNTLSGLLPIEIEVNFTDANGAVGSRKITMNIVVLSGPPTAMSISYTGVEHNTTVAKYTEKFAVTVTDAYNNPVNTKPYIATGAIVEYAVDGSSPTGTRTVISPRLWHGTNDPRGELEAIGGNKAQFTTTTDVFNHVDINNDRLVVFGAGYVYESLGKWDLDSIASQVLTLKDDYYGITRSDLGFAVGHNNRQDLCEPDQREYVGNMKSKSYQIDENGHVLIEFEYDYHLTGKNIMVWVNLTGFQADNNTTGRIGEAKKHTLRGNGLVPVPENGYSIPKGKTRAGQSFAIHHENASEWYINGKFGWRIKSGSTCGYSIDDSTNLYDARTCYGAAKIIFTLTAPADKDCTFAIEGINTRSEFTGVNTH
ncbi:MAG: hypothetical protein HF962_02870 [Sulfurovum sp.]|nr:hypothetical protein [Sulfurovum sp.]